MVHKFKVNKINRRLVKKKVSPPIKYQVVSSPITLMIIYSLQTIPILIVGKSTLIKHNLHIPVKEDKLNKILQQVRIDIYQNLV